LKQLIRLTLITSIFSLAACSTGGSFLKSLGDADSTTPTTQQKHGKVSADAIEYRDFDLDKDSLYDLLVAEISAQRNQFSITILNYIQQARMTRDVNIIKRAINAAQLLKDTQALQEMAKLWVEVEPDSIPAHQLLAFQHSLNKEYADAMHHMGKILQLGGEARVDSLAASSKPLPQEEKLLLLDLYQKLYQEFPNNNEVGYSYALVQRNLEHYEAASLTLEPILNNSPEFEAACILKANLLYDTGKLEEAIEYADDKFDTFPANHNLGRLFASMLIEDKQLQRAEAVFKSLMELYPQAPSLKLSHALVMLENSKIEAAKIEFNELITAGAHKNESNFYLGRIADQAKETEKAIEHYTQVTQSIHFEPALERASFLLTKSGKIDKMIGRLTLLRESRPKMALKLWLLQFKLLSNIKDEARALETLEQAIIAFPKDEQLLYARAMKLEAAGNLAGMESDLRKLIQNNPKNAIAINALGYTLADKTDRLKEAFGLIQVALSIQPENPAILDSMGWVLYRLNKHQEALVFLLKAFQSYPDGEVAAHLGEVLWVLNQKTEAEKVWLTILGKTPNHKALLETIKRLQPSLLESPPTSSSESTESTESIESTESPENTESTESTESTENTESAESTESPESTESTESIESTESTESTESPENTESTESTESPENTESAESTESPENTESAESIDPEEVNTEPKP